YVLAAADVGKKITVTVTGSKSGYVTAAKTSAATVAVTAPKALTAGTPTISGTTVSGQKLTANAGIWGPAAVTLKYQWKRNGVVIANATASAYVLAAADVGKKITVTVTGSKSGYVTAAKTSAATVAVTAKK
ncbi:carboxypeptidase regulatory-like domain-containing protein, partial [Arthrobacter sp. Sr24]